MNFQGKHGPLLIAEIGGNHEGNFEYAKKLTELAISTDVDYVKFQMYTGDSIVSRIESPERNQHFKKFELTIQQYIELAQMVTTAGIGFMASVWNKDYIEIIDKYLPIYKVGSGDLTAFPLLEIIAKTGKPIILSTGLSTLDDIIESVSFIQKVNKVYTNNNFLAVLQCTTMYPIENGDANLLVMEELRKRTGLTIGYSDHTVGIKALCTAVAMGAQVLEFHFTDDREGKTFRDHKVSLVPHEVKALIAEIKEIRILRGDGLKQPLPIELSNGNVISFRRSLYAAKDLSIGQLINSEDIVALRPNTGIDAREYENVIGKTLVVSKKAFEKINWGDLQ